jgi:hypothetical protein
MECNQLNTFRKEDQFRFLNTIWTKERGAQLPKSVGSSVTRFPVKNFFFRLGRIAATVLGPIGDFKLTPADLIC